MSTTASTFHAPCALIVLASTVLLVAACSKNPAEPKAIAAKSAPAATATGAAKPGAVLFRNVRIFNGKGDSLSDASNVLVRGNVIAAIGPAAKSSAAKVIDGGGRTLMPGLIDAITPYASASPRLALLTAESASSTGRRGEGADDMLMRGFTSMRDLGGPVFGLKRGIDRG